MNRRFSLWLGLTGLASMLVGCDYSSSRPALTPLDVEAGPLPSAPGRPQAPSLISSESVAPSQEIPPEIQKRTEVIMANFIKLIQTASANPGGQNFAMATDNLNDLFAQGTKPGDFDYSPKSRDFLLKKIFELYQVDPEPHVKSLCSDKFTPRDARHIEDCMLYRAIANRIAGEGDDLTRVRRIFDWTVRNVLLIPPQSLAGNGVRQAQARPADVLFRGMATEDGDRWSERGWVFMALCRQIGVDVGLLTYMTRASVLATPESQANRRPNTWICGAAINEKLYLFDQRIGIEIPSADGQGVATLEEAITNPTVLARLDLPGISSYPGPSATELAGSTSKIGVLMDSSPGYLAPRMRLLQGQLRREYRTVLFRDPLEQARTFAKALGPRLGIINFWDLPLFVEQKLFSDPTYVAATQMSLQFFDGKLPLLYARTAHLRGDLAEATNKYVVLRKRTDAVMNDPQKTPIPPEIQRALDFYSTYFLAQCHIDQGNVKQAEDMYRQLLDLCPEPGPGRYYYYMIRWSALSNLARICEAKGDHPSAIAFYTRDCATFQRHGNLLRARNLVWNHPFEEPAPTLPSAPPLPPTEMKAVLK